MPEVRSIKSLLDTVNPIVEFPLTLFVYGTLKRGMGNQHYLQRCTFQRQASAFGILLHLGGYPGFIPETTGMSISGELWTIPDEKALERLDALEGHPNYYTRQRISIAGGSECWTYVFTSYHTQRANKVRPIWHHIPSGSWVGADTGKMEFLGFFEEEWPKKTPHLASAHVRIKGKFAGLIDTNTGMILRDNFRADGKPHFTFDQATGLWAPSTDTKVIDVQATVIRNRPPVIHQPVLEQAKLPPPPPTTAATEEEFDDPDEAMAPRKDKVA